MNQLYEEVLKVRNLIKIFKIYKSPKERLKEWITGRTYHSKFKAIDNVNFSIRKGEFVSIIGPNGAGKSTLLKLISGTLKPTSGEIKAKGKVVSILELGTGFNYELSGLDNIYLNGILLGLSKKEIDKKIKNIIKFAELEPFIKNPLKTYSSGMIVRLAFSIAIQTRPDLFIVDEALAVGDARFQQKCFEVFRNLKKMGTSVLFVSHDIPLVQRLSDKVILLYKGKIFSKGKPEKVIRDYNYLLAAMESNKNSVCLRNENSFGNYLVKIKDIRFKGKKSKGRTIQSGEKANISILIESTINTDNVTVGLLIRNRFGIDVFGTNTHLLGKKVSIKKGEVKEISFEVEMNLAPGRYTLTVALHEGKTHDTQCFHWLDNVLEFEITGFYKQEFVGEVFLPTKIKINTVSKC